MIWRLERLTGAFAWPPGNGRIRFDGIRELASECADIRDAAFLYNVSLRNGFQWIDIGILSATASTLVGLDAWRFARRDINT